MEKTVMSKFMSKSASLALDELYVLDVDNFIFISEDASEHAQGSAARSHGLEKAAPLAPDDAIGLDVAPAAPDGTPVTPVLPDHPGGPSGSSFEISSGILLHQPLEFAYAKPSGTPGGGGNGGGGGGDGGGGGGGTYTTPTYFWGVDLGQEDIDGRDNTVDPYNIRIEFYGDATLWGAVDDGNGGYSGGFLDAFLGSGDFLTSMIMSGYDSSDYFGPYPDIEAGLTGTQFWADDLVIEAYLTDIDGVGGILGRAGPYEETLLAGGDGVYEKFPAVGLMEFDTSDAANLLSGTELGGLWNDVVLHEMMHVLGFGTLWGVETEGDTVPNWDGLVDLGTGYIYDNGTRKPNDDTTFFAYNGDEANNEVVGSGAYFNLEGEPHLAVERDGGAGTAGGHWDEVLYDDEIMTGYINSLNDGKNVGANYLADFTVAAFADLGYDINGDYDVIAAAGTEFLETGNFETWLGVSA
jgi:hypothetical protein